MKQILSSLFILMLLCTSVIAQDRTVRGTVNGKDDGLPLPGVSVRLKGTGIGTQTGADGKFSIGVTGNNAVLVFTYIGYSNQEVSVGNRSTVNVSLGSDATQLGEVVVTGYGTKQVKDLTGSVGSVKGDKIAQQPLPSFDQALSGKLAGVQIGSSGGILGDGVSIRIRGVNSISASSLPLVVIDGIPTNNVENINLFNDGNGTRFNPLALLNPNDIESIEVLKDAGASVLYGSRAANGVVIITTKKGKKGTSNISFDSKAGWSEAASLPKLLTPEQFIEISNEKAANAAARFGGSVVAIARDSDLDGDGMPDRVNWLDELYRTGFSFDNSLTMSGGSEKSTYYGSARYIDQKGINVGNSLKTGQVRLNYEVTPKKWLKSGINLAYSKSFNKGILSDRYLAGATVSGYNAFPTVAVRNPSSLTGYNLNANGTLDYGNNLVRLNGTSLIQNTIYNPIAAVNLNRNESTPESIQGNIFVEVQPVQGLRVTSKFGVDNLRNFEDQFSDPNIGGLGLSFNGLVQDYYRTRNQWVWQNYVSYDKTFAQYHRLSLTGGAEYQFVKERQTYAGASDFADPFFKDIIDGVYSGNDAGGDLQLWSGGDLFSNGVQSYFGRVGYTFNDKYMIEGAFRADAFSGFGENSKWGYFPSISAGWTISQEDFMRSVDWVDFLKVRGSYGRVGNSRGVGSYAARTLYGGGLYASQNGFSTSQSGDANLEWETSKKLDIGVDVNFLDSRVNVVADYFNNDISGLLLQAPVLYTVGIPDASIFTNIGSMYNRGFEFTLNTVNVKKRDFTWTTSLNFTGVKNRVTKLVSEGADLPDPNFGGSVASVGKPLGEYRLIRWAGVDPQTGNGSFYTAAGERKFFDPATQLWTLEDGSTTTGISGADAVYTGKTGQPKYYGGLDNTFTYKNLDLGLSFVYTGGFYVYNSTRSGMLTGYFQNNYAEIMDRWTTPGQVTDVPRVYLNNNTANQTSDRFLEKGDFLRLRTVSLGYTFRQPVFSQLGFTNLRIYGQIYNAFLISGYSGPDPEVNYNRNNTNIATAIDNRAVPQPRVYTFGLNVGF